MKLTNELNQCNDLPSLAKLIQNIKSQEIGALGGRKFIKKDGSAKQGNVCLKDIVRKFEVLHLNADATLDNIDLAHKTLGHIIDLDRGGNAKLQEASKKNCFIYILTKIRQFFGNFFYNKEEKLKTFLTNLEEQRKLCLQELEAQNAAQQPPQQPVQQQVQQPPQQPHPHQPQTQLPLQQPEQANPPVPPPPQAGQKKAPQADAQAKGASAPVVDESDDEDFEDDDDESDSRPNSPASGLSLAEIVLGSHDASKEADEKESVEDAFKNYSIYGLFCVLVSEDAEGVGKQWTGDDRIVRIKHRLEVALKYFKAKMEIIDRNLSEGSELQGELKQAFQLILDNNHQLPDNKQYDLLPELAKLAGWDREKLKATLEQLTWPSQADREKLLPEILAKLASPQTPPT